MTWPRAFLLGPLVVALSVGAYVSTSPSPPTTTFDRVIVSGTPGLRTTPDGKHERWGAGPLTLTLDASLDTMAPAAKDAVKAAFGEWASSDASLPALVFDSSTAHGKVAQDGKNLVLFGPITLKGHEHDVATTISYVDAQSGEMLEADTIFNSAYSFGVLATPATSDDDDESTSCASRYDVQNVATHEAGHFFGLGEDTEDSHATMYLRSNPCETHKRALTAVDRTVIVSLYAEPAAAPAAGAAHAKACTVATPGGGTGACWYALGGLAAAFVGLRRRRR